MSVLQIDGPIALSRYMRATSQTWPDGAPAPQRSDGGKWKEVRDRLAGHRATQATRVDDILDQICRHLLEHKWTVPFHEGGPERQDLPEAIGAGIGSLDTTRMLDLRSRLNQEGFALVIYRGGMGGEVSYTIEPASSDEAAR